MDLYARINILGGRSVRLRRGDVHDAILLDNDPVARARSWVDQGADLIHVVDLDAAVSRDYRNRDMIDRMIESVAVPVQVAGGIRSPSEATRLIEAGAWRVVMGTAAIEDQNMVWELCRDHPDKIVVSLDVRGDEEIATRGWTRNSGRFLEEVLLEMSAAGAAAFLVAEAGRDALIEPPDLEILSEAISVVTEPVIGAGGVRNLDDLRDLMALESEGRRLAGVIVGREVTHGRFTIDEAKQVLAETPREMPAALEQSAAPSSGMVLSALLYSRAAAALDQATGHARVAEQRYLAGDLDGGAARGYAATGEMARAKSLLEEAAAHHADHIRDPE